MPIATIQLDDSQWEDAQAIAAHLIKTEVASNQYTAEHVLHSAVILGLEQLRNIHLPTERNDQ